MTAPNRLVRNKYIFDSRPSVFVSHINLEMVIDNHVEHADSHDVFGRGYFRLKISTELIVQQVVIIVSTWDKTQVDYRLETTPSSRRTSSEQAWRFLFIIQ